MDDYVLKIKSRKGHHFLLGLLVRLYLFVINYIILTIARLKGAKIGVDSIINFKLACKANSNLIIGANSIIEAEDLDLREKVFIGSNVIINKDVMIIRQSHNFDSSKFETIGFPLHINDFAWITTGATILPSCQIIDEGCIVGAKSVVAKNLSKMDIAIGNPCYIIRKRKVLPLEHNNCTMQGLDLIYYFKARFYENNK